MAIIAGNDEIREVAGIQEDEKQAIIHFLQGAVYCWCKNRKNEWFSMRDLMGGDNYFWEGTPLRPYMIKISEVMMRSNQLVRIPDGC